MAVIHAVFLSAVNNEFGPLRESLRTAIEATHWKVWTQHNLPEAGEPTLEKLDSCIRDCDCVVQLAGRELGSKPRQLSLAWIKKNYPDFSEKSGAPDEYLLKPSSSFSLTQWEAWLALYHGKSLLMLGSKELVDALRPARLEPPPGCADTLQRKHLALLWSLEKRCNAYASELTLHTGLLVSLDKIKTDLLARAAAQADGFAWTPLPEPADTTGGHFVGREWLFDEINAWAATPNSKPMLLLGGFGMGKTAAMLELLQRWKGRRVISHFCQFNDDRTLRPGGIVLNIAAQLSALVPDYKQAVESDKYLQTLLADADENPVQALRDAVFAPLKRLGGDSPEEFVLIIDALDESLEITTEPGRNTARAVTLVDLVVDASIAVPPWFRILISSRPIDRVDNATVRDRFKTTDFEKSGQLHSDEDISNYVAIRAAADSRIEAFLQAAGRPAADLAEKLSRSVEGRFLLANYVLNDIQEGYIAAEEFEQLPVRVGAFYGTAFGRRLSKAKLDPAQVRALLGLVAVARVRISARTLARILPSTTVDQVEAIFRAFSGLLVKDSHGGINFVHASLEEWLDDKGAPAFPTPPEYVIHREEAENDLTRYCKQMTLLQLEQTGEFSSYLENYGVRLLLEKQEFASAIVLLNALRARLTELSDNPDRDTDAARAALEQICAKQTVLVADRVRARWAVVDAAAGSQRQQFRAPLANIEPDQLQPLLYNKDYETGKYVPLIRVLLECHPDDWQVIKAELLTMADENDIVFRHDSGVAYAQAWHAAGVQGKKTLMDELKAMALDRGSGDRREMAGYALKYICEQTDRKSWWGGPALPTIKSLAFEYARSGHATDRMVAGEMLLALAIQGEPVTQWFSDDGTYPPFWDPCWPNHRADINAIRTVLDERVSTWATIADDAESLPQCRAQQELALKLSARLLASSLMRDTPVGRSLAGMLAGNVAQQTHAKALDHKAVNELARLLRMPEHRDDILSFIRYLMLHPLWNATERGSTLVAALVKRDATLKFIIADLAGAEPSAWRIRYGAVDAAYNCGIQDNYACFFDLLIRFGKDPSCRVRGICIDDLIGWIKDATKAEIESRLGQTEIIQLINFWLVEANDVWLLEYLHDLFHDLQELKQWSDERITALMRPSAGKLSLYLKDPGFYKLDSDAFMAQIEDVRRQEWEQTRGVAG